MSICRCCYEGAPVVIFVKSKLIRSRRKKFEVIRGRDHEMRADWVLRNWVWSGFIRANGEILCILNTKDFSIRPYETRPSPISQNSIASHFMIPTSNHLKFFPTAPYELALARNNLHWAPGRTSTDGTLLSVKMYSYELLFAGLLLCNAVFAS